MQISNRIFVLLLSHLYYLANGASGTCQLLSRDATTNFVNPCGSIVDYNFFIPNAYIAIAKLSGISPEQFLLKQVQKQLNLATLKSLTTSCQQTIKSLTCASIYPKCYLNQTYTGNQQKLNYQPYSVDSNYSYGIQVYRPCASLCTNMPLNCVGLYPLANKYPNCTMRTDYSYGAAPANKAPLQYDKSNDPATCFVPKSVTVAESKEKYLYASTGVCAGLVQDVFVPAGPTINSTFAVLQQPFAMQRFVEAAALARWIKIPKWLKPSCLSAARKFICSQAFLFPLVKTFPQILTENNVLAPYQAGIAATMPTLYNTVFTLPGFYEATVCSNFQLQCSGFLKLAGTVANCSRTTISSGLLIKYFPTNRQTISMLPFTPITPVLYIYSDVQSYGNATSPQSSSSLVTCPATFVIPNDLNDPNAVYAPIAANSSCAVSCNSPGMDNDTWGKLVVAAFVVPLIGLILSSLMVLSLVHTYLAYWKEKSSQGISKFTNVDIQALLLFLYAVLSGIVSAYSVALNSKERESRFCYSNAVPYSLAIGQSMCTTQAAIIVYTFIGSSITFLIMALLRVAHRWQIYATGAKGEYSAPVAFGIAGLSLLIILLGPVRPLTFGYAKKLFGFARSNAICHVLQRPTYDDATSTQALDIPMLWTGCLWLLLCLLDMGTPLWLWLTKVCRCCLRGTHDNRIYLAGATEESGKAKNGPEPNTAAVAAEEVYQDGSMPLGKKAEVELTTISGKPSGLQQPKPLEQPNDVSSAGSGYDSLLYFLPILVIYLVFLINRLIYFVAYDSAYNSLRDWMKCLFTNSNTWAATCGNAPGDSPPLSLLISVLVVLTGHSIIFVPVFFFNCYVLPLIWKGKGDRNKQPPAQIAGGNRDSNNNVNNNNNNNINNNNNDEIGNGSAVQVVDGAVPPAAVLDHVQDIENGDHAT